MKRQTIEFGPLGRVIESYTGILHRPAGELSGVLARIEHEEYEPSGLKATLFHSGLGTSFDSKEFLFEDTSECRMTCGTPLAFPINFWGVQGWSSSRDKIELDLSGYDIGISEDLLMADEEITVIAYLTRGRLSGWRRSPVRWWDGAITFSIDKEKREDEKEDSIEWTDASKTTTLRIQHEYEDANCGENKVVLQIARPAMVRTLKTDGTQSLKSIVQDAQNDLKDICLMLSLASRQKVQWYEITARSHKSRDISVTSPTAKRRIGRLTSRYSEHEDPLIDHRDLVNGGFKDLLSRFQCCQHREMLRRAIAFEIASHEIGGGLESNYILCYSALEAIAGETLTADSSIHRYLPSQWKLLRRTLEKTIAEFGVNQGLLSTLVDYTQKRLPGLARPAIADVILHLTQSLSVKVDDLWPEDVPFEQGLRAALRIRNLLVHRAIIVDANAMHDNLVRLQALTERFILKLLGWPENKVWVWANQRLKRVNK